MQTEQVQTKRTRAQVLRDKVVVRLALDETAPAVARILSGNGLDIPCDRIFPNWLIATVDDDVIGIVQVLPAKPVGYLNFLYTQPGVSFKLRAIAIRKLIAAGMSTVQLSGARYVLANIDSKSKFFDVAEKLHFVRAGETALMVKAL